jgi:hypothetical protein
MDTFFYQIAQWLSGITNGHVAGYPTGGQVGFNRAGGCGDRLARLGT